MDSGSLEYNIIVVKWGNKFTPEHVNRLYRMAKRNITLPFNFYCHTEDPTGIYDEVNIVPLDVSLSLEKWWWKLTLFKQNNLGNGINLFFDLDIIIQNNIDYFFKKAIHDKIIIIDHEKTEMYLNDIDPPTDPYYNSSIMIWYNNENKEIYKKFITNYKLYTKIYHGIDRFLSHEISTSKFLSLNNSDFYFRNLIRENEIHDESYFIRLYEPTERFSRPARIPVFFNKNIPICVFNGCHEDVFYQGMEKFLL